MDKYIIIQKQKQHAVTPESQATYGNWAHAKHLENHPERPDGNVRVRCHGDNSGSVETFESTSHITDEHSDSNATINIGCDSAAEVVLKKQGYNSDSVSMFKIDQEIPSR